MQKRDVILTAVFSSLAGLILVAALGAACYFFHKRRRKRDREEEEEDSQGVGGGVGGVGTSHRASLYNVSLFPPNTTPCSHPVEAARGGGSTGMLPEPPSQSDDTMQARNRERVAPIFDFGGSILYILSH
ncbi:unnamed protein product [Phaedon cochleariae]|uniref:Uncharacterized protein n=1 Tax=Phaedon cochleariae TaxID=80249 RepID=A0A9N9SD81_PHACE|nr:unnamed protein product [Phaedon cochleariae]